MGVTPIRIYPGSPRENGYNERFNGTWLREVLNAEWFTTTEQAQIVIDHWLKQYNHIRPHQALKMRPTAPETLLEKPLIGGPDTGGRHSSKHDQPY
ncbi:MAG: transposase [Pseudomonadota bacterium]